MFQKIPLLFLIITIVLSSVIGQTKNVQITGMVVDDSFHPVESVNIHSKGNKAVTLTDKEGQFHLETVAGSRCVLRFTCQNYKTSEKEFKPSADTTIHHVIYPLVIELPEVVVSDKRNAQPSVINLNPSLIHKIPDVNGGSVEQLVKTLPGVSSNNEMSSTYSVRGGNYDENLIYVDGIEIKRPFLVKEGQQEGLSFINSSMVSSIRFSNGGYESQYGDKLSSVLDIDYRIPEMFGGSLEIGALGGSAHLEGRALKDKFFILSGIRYKDNRYLLGTLDEKGHYSPSFLDFQTFLGYEFSPRFSIHALANIASNTFSFTPETRETSYGTMNLAYQLKIYFDGKEKNQYDNYTGAILATYKAGKNLDLKLIASTFFSNENENYDILAQYYLHEIVGTSISTSPTDSSTSLGIGSSLVHARNYLNAKILSLEQRGDLRMSNHLLSWGIKIDREKIEDKINEWEMRDSAGYSLPYNNETINLFSSTKAHNDLNSYRTQLFIQDRFTLTAGKGLIGFNGGGRLQYWSLNGQTIFSPRMSVYWYPSENKSNRLSFSWGVYQQMPFFKELKGSDQIVRYNVKAQKSIHYALAYEYPFMWRDYPFRFSSAIWYKALPKIIPYRINNLDIQYFPESQAKGYATGLDLKLYGDLVPGATSWISFTLMKAEEDIRDDFYISVNSKTQVKETIYPGYMPRPSDQRFKFALFFQDYFPRNPSVKMSLMLVYGSGLPFGPPRSDQFHTLYRMPSYRRVDVGFSKMFISSEKGKIRKVLNHHIKDAWISLELLNLFDINNTISYYWVNDIQSNQHAVPNYLTGRRINLKVAFSF